MKRSILWFGFLVLFLSFVATPSFATSHTITYFRGNMAGAVSLTFDDGYQSQVTMGVPGLNAYGWNGTFFVVTEDSWINSHVGWATWRSVASLGHEIGSHTVTHADLTTLRGNNPKSQLSESQATIDQNIPSQSCISFAYPYGDTDQSVQAHAKKYYVAARVAGPGGGSVLNHYTAGSDMYGSWQPIDFYNVGAQGVDVSIPPTAPPDYVYLGTILDVAVSRHAWAVFYFHEVQDSGAFGNFLGLVYTRNVWVDTFGNISRYMKERLSSGVQVLNDTSSSITLKISMEGSLKGGTYNVPLTLRSTVPVSWIKVKVQQGSSIQIFTPVLEGSDSVVYYDAVPNGSQITLTPM
jgi:peptidoglycan/xylan/chitin deacetylase (PgdA/CDA1 family)